MQDAFVRAAERWPRDGVPANPGAWIVATARNRAIDRIRRERTLARKTELLARAERLPDDEEAHDPRRAARADLRLLPPGARRRGAGGADAEPRRRPDDAGDRARLPRAGADARAAARAREAEDPRRRDPAAGAARAPAPGAAAHGASRRSISSSTPATGSRCAASSAARRSGSRRCSRRCCPTRRRRTACTRCCSSRTRVATPASRRRASWCCSPSRTARSGTNGARARAPRARARAGAARPGPYQLQAAIASLHLEPETDWAQIALLYERLGELAPSPVVELNRAVAVASRTARGRARARRRDPGLGGYHLWHSARADLLRRLGRDAEARMAYGRALELAPARSSGVHPPPAGGARQP